MSAVEIQHSHVPSNSYAIISMEVPRYFVPEMLFDGVQLISITNKNSGWAYAPKWKDINGKDVVKLNNLDSINLEYLRVCHKAMEAYKKMLETGVDGEQIKAVLPPYTVSDAIFTASIPQWETWTKRMLQSKNSLHRYLASKVVGLIKK